MNVKTIFTLADAAHAAAVEKGFYEEEKTLARLVSLIISESGEIVEAMRKDRHFNPANYAIGGPFVAQQFEAEVKDTVGDEIADTIIRLLDCLGCYLNNFEMPEYHVDLLKKNAKEFLGKFDSGIASTWEDLYLICCKNIISVANITPTYVTISGSFSLQIIVSIRLLYFLAEKMGVPDIDFHIQEKMKYNRTRPHMHGKKF